MKLGYARVSTTDQDLGRQIAALKAAGCERIFQDKMSGKESSRPELDAMLESLQPGDIVVVLKLDRLGRSLKNLIELIDRFRKLNVQFVSLGESIDTNTAAGKMMFSVIGALAEFEREIIVERVNHGLAHAKSLGRVGGRPKVNAINVREFHRQGFSNTDIAKKMNISTKSVSRVLKAN